MAFSRLVFTVLLVSVCCYASNVPVFIWGETAKSLKSNPLENIESEDFQGILKDVLADASETVVFSEETLSVEDFSLKNSNGETAFPYLQNNVKDSTYLASVDDPLSVLEEYPVKLVTLPEAREGESRFDLLRRHDAFIQDTISKLPKSSVGILTAQNPSWVVPVTNSRSRRQAGNESQGEVLQFDGLRIYAKSFKIIDGETVVTLEGVPSGVTNFNDTLMSTTVTFRDNAVIFNFRQAGGYWFFDSVTVNPTGDRKDLAPTVDLYALDAFSYRCAQSVLFSGPNSTQSFIIEDLKVQPYFKSTSNETVQFGDSFNCVGFFSPAIWSGLFVVFILLSITFYGIMMMMDIRTMDRFDDPKGKTITINAGE